MSHDLSTIANHEPCLHRDYLITGDEKIRSDGKQTRKESRIRKSVRYADNGDERSELCKNA